MMLNNCATRSTRKTRVNYQGAFVNLILSSLIVIFFIGRDIESLESGVRSERGNEDAVHKLFKRQTSSTIPSANSGQSSQSGSDKNQPDGGQSSEQEKPPEETLTSLKCSFGSADAPDLCKFHLLDNPLSKDLPGWTHGNGKLALYQGGPLLDASGGNDTSGGYIFYETSSLYSANMINQTMQIPVPSTIRNTARQQHQQNQRPLSSNWQYYGTNSNSNGNNNQREFEEYRRVSSAQYSITGNNNNNNNNQVGQAFNNAKLQNSAPTMMTQSTVSMMMHSNHHHHNDMAAINGPVFTSPNMTATSVAGMCLSFHYAIKGLSANELRVNVNDLKTGKSRLIWSASESAAGNWTRAEILYSATNKHAIQFAATHHQQQQHHHQQQHQQANNNNNEFQHQKFRGYVAVDEIEIDKHDALGSDTAACRGHCNFDGDLCGWTNAENGPEGDDFDWSFGRGSDNLFTGPARDFVSSSNNELTGSYLQIDPSYPRRPGDRASLVSPLFQPTTTNDAMCMRLAVHMFGSGIGTLAIKIRYTDEVARSSGGSGGPAGNSGQATSGGSSNAQGSSASSGGGGGSQGGAGAGTSSSSSSATSSSSSSSSSDKVGANDLVIWEMSGDSGNVWHQAQTSVSSSKSPFYVVIEGTIGENHLSNIAIDEISFSQGACPSSPPIASKNYGDCTFEQSMCYWRNPNVEIHLDDLDWIRMAEEQTIHGPNQDHTTKKRSGSYLKLENTLREPKSGMRAFLLSPIFQPRQSVQCLSFYYYMFMRSISSSGPNLGTIRVYLASNNELTPIWRLTNPISSPIWKHARVSLSSMMLDGQPVAPTKLFQIAFEGIWGDAAGGAIALDDVTVFDGACDLMPIEARAVPGECTFDVDLCSWINKTSGVVGAQGDAYMLDGSGPSADSPSSSPFIQYINSGSPQAAAKQQQQLAAANSGWQLATVNSRPINLQDHTYKAPIGYVYVDVLDPISLNARVPAVLQSNEVVIQQQGQPMVQCLSFWFAAFGRSEANQLQVYLTQASQPPPQPEEGGAPVDARSSASGSSGASQSNRQSTNSNSQGLGGTVVGDSTSGSAATDPSLQAWKNFDGKLIWSVGLRNMTEATRRRWDYAQVSLKVDSNYIVRFIALSSDGGFALDDISYYDGACETRPAVARIQSSDDDSTSSSGASGSGSATSGGSTPSGNSGSSSGGGGGSVKPAGA